MCSGGWLHKKLILTNAASFDSITGSIHPAANHFAPGSFWLLAPAPATATADVTDATAASDAVFILCEGTCCNYQDQDKQKMAQKREINQRRAHAEEALNGVRGRVHTDLMEVDVM